MNQLPRAKIDRLESLVLAVAEPQCVSEHAELPRTAHRQLAFELAGRRDEADRLLGDPAGARAGAGEDENARRRDGGDERSGDGEPDASSPKDPQGRPPKPTAVPPGHTPVGGQHLDGRNRLGEALHALKSPLAVSDSV